MTGVPVENEAMEGATFDHEKLRKVWTDAGITEEIKSYQRLGTMGEGRSCC